MNTRWELKTLAAMGVMLKGYCCMLLLISQSQGTFPAYTWSFESTLKNIRIKLTFFQLINYFQRPTMAVVLHQL